MKYLILAFLLVGCNSSLSPAQQQMLKAINTIRAHARYCGEYYKKAVPPLAWSQSLEDAAEEHVEDMIEQDYFSHQGSGEWSDKTAIIQKRDRGSHFYERIWRRESFEEVGENIAAGFEPSEVVEAYLNSPHHCENIMSPKFKHFGWYWNESNQTYYASYEAEEFGG